MQILPLNNRPVQILPLNKNITFHKRLAYMVRRTVAPSIAASRITNPSHAQSRQPVFVCALRTLRSIGYSRRSAQYCTDHS